MNSKEGQSAMVKQTFDRGVPIRAISRGIAVIQATNRIGPISMMEISRAANIPYPTACRIVQTLIHEGFIEREPARKRYRVTGLVQTLSTGFQAEDELVTVARDHIVALTHKLNWPISLATRVGTSMMVRDSTHGLTSLTFTNYYPGYTLPISECATGKAYMTDNDTSKVGLLLVRDGSLLSEIRKNGYAIHNRNTYTADDGKTSSIAVPIMRENGIIAGTIGLIYFASAMNASKAAEQFLTDLQATASKVAHDLAQIEDK
jgi:IclR family mhp operon transcriptional activator